MVNITSRIIVFLTAFIFFISFISATFTIGNASHSIQTSYTAGAAIKGWINISLQEQPVNSIIENNLGESINLIGLLATTINNGFEYTCNPSSCTSNYFPINPTPSKILNLGNDESIVIGFNVSAKKNIDTITKFSLRFLSDNPKTEEFPLLIDILNDGQIEWYAYQFSGTFDEENFGCFIGTPLLSKTEIGTSPYCEKINLFPTPRLELGAYVEGTGSSTFEMKIERVDTGEAKPCQASASGTGRISCVPSNYSVKTQGDYFVCIKRISTSNYKIKYEETTPCGFSGEYNGQFYYDFDIFARPGTYAPIINFTLNNTELKNANSPVRNIEQYIKNYISDMYNNNCSKGCTIPIKISSGIPQKLTISNPSLEYTAGIAYSLTDISDTQETTATMTSDSFQRLYLDESDFNAPLVEDSYDFSVNIDGDEILSDSISVTESATIQSVSPTSTARGYPTTFKVKTNAANISKYSWNFGDGTIESTTTASATHTYNALGTYVLIIDIGDYSADFNITVGPASTIVPSLLMETEIRLQSIQEQSAQFSVFEQESIESILNLGFIEDKLVKLKEAVSLATSEEEYETILGELLAIELPETIARTAMSEGILFYPETDNIDLNILSKIGGGSYEGKEAEYREAVLGWEGTNIEAIMTYSEISLVENSNQEPFLKIFDINIANNEGGDSYIIIKKMDDIMFKRDYSETEKAGYYYLKLGNEVKDIAFSTSENVDFVSLPMFISPTISKLSLEETVGPAEENVRKWGLFSIIVGILLFIGIVVWVVLQQWYKRRYENHLFKNRNHLYNLVNYIHTEKRNGVKERDILSNLRKAGWSSEQLRYVIRKYAGRRTGMLEIPIDKVIKKIFGKEKANVDNTNGANFQRRQY